MKIFSIMILLLIVAGCEEVLSPEFVMLSSYHCDDEQIKLLDAEFSVCNRSSYHSSFCFKQAKVTQCTKIDRAVDYRGVR